MKRVIIAVVAVLAVAGGVWKWQAGARRGRGEGRGRAVDAVRGPISQSVDATGSVAPRTASRSSRPSAAASRSCSSTRGSASPRAKSWLG
ncbi:MAG: hypothetical protein M0D55_12755 [Elusimicrobiota bacterium]|nr:MAG: hypothetical protein M0D55_12755 [Elusimicrobiota bacterium]